MALQLCCLARRARAAVGFGRAILSQVRADSSGQARFLGTRAVALAPGRAKVSGWPEGVDGGIAYGLGTGFIGGHFFRGEDFSGLA